MTSSAIKYSKQPSACVNRVSDLTRMPIPIKPQNHDLHTSVRAAALQLNALITMAVGGARGARIA
jgi:hypothetical protein